MGNVAGFTCYDCKAESDFSRPEIRILSESRDLRRQHLRNYTCSSCGKVNEVERAADEWRAIDGRLC